MTGATQPAGQSSLTRGYRASSGSQLKQTASLAPHPVGYSWGIDFYILQRAHRAASRPITP
jgi:hypothetical protein